MAKWTDHLVICNNGKVMISMLWWSAIVWWVTMLFIVKKYYVWIIWIIQKRDPSYCDNKKFSIDLNCYICLKDTSRGLIFWFDTKILNSGSHDLGLLSLYIFWGKCVYFSIFEWENLQLCFVWHNSEFYHSKIEK